jgi:DNA-binding NarL/FixJ family response regulator
MIVCVVDDLIFSIKISTAAKHLGVDMFFERSKDKVVQTIRDKQPSLVIFDLNSGRLAPMAAIAAMKADAELAGIPTLGFVSHVDSDTINAARAAGIGQVLARSAFSDRLGDILSSGATTPAPPRPPT